MKFLLTFFLIVAAVNATLLPPQTNSYEIPPYGQRQFNLQQSAEGVIQRLLDSLRKAANEATNAIESFNTRIQNEAKNIQDRITGQIQKLWDRVANAINDASNMVLESGAGVADCFSKSRDKAAELLDDTLTKSLQCVDDRKNRVTEQLGSLTDIANNITEHADKVLQDMRQCTKQSENFLTASTCLGGVAVRAELKTAMFAAQTTAAIGRISLTVASLPASLEVCAGARLFEAGIATTGILMEIGRCSASSTYTTITGPGSSAPAVEAVNPEEALPSNDNQLEGN